MGQQCVVVLDFFEACEKYVLGRGGRYSVRVCRRPPDYLEKPHGASFEGSVEQLGNEECDRCESAQHRRPVWHFGGFTRVFSSDYEHSNHAVQDEPEQSAVEEVGPT